MQITENSQPEKIIYYIFQLYDTLERHNYGNSERICGCQGLVGEEGMNRKRTFRAVKLSCVIL